MTYSLKSIILRPGREKSLLRRHPWVFSGAIAKVNGAPLPGESIDILASDGKWLGTGAYSPASQITVRVWSFNKGEEVSPAFFRSRLQQAIGSRQHLLKASGTNACRLVFSESDGLPGLIVDRYAGFLVCQFLSAGAEYWKSTIVELLAELAPNEGIYERSESAVRGKEGLPRVSGVLSGMEPPELIEVTEGAYSFLVDVRRGHKTGFYLDQRDSRAAVAAFAEGAEALNCFSYTGGFSVAALKAGAAAVTNIDSSSDALGLAGRNVMLNGLDIEKVQNVEGDVFTVMRSYRDEGRSFDMVILDPPKFAESQAQMKRACRGYKDINLLAFKLLRPGGLLFTFSCSGLMDNSLFQKITADAALDAGREACVIRRLSQPEDHPTLLSFPEADYLKGLVCRAQ